MADNLPGAWDTRPQPTPLENFRALDAFVSGKGMPLLSAARVYVSSETYDRLTGKPLSCDLTADPLACAILRAWARQPWQEAHRAALVDHLEETGRTAPETEWLRVARNPELADWPGWNRTTRRLVCGSWGRVLAAQFGDFENTLCDGTEDTPQGG